ncbi:MAG: hypothetical protein JKY56_00515 [Kofleriaceae bacterium]|nr:hypothetical protein [Kofleriaceae bacterium]
MSPSRPTFDTADCHNGYMRICVLDLGGMSFHLMHAMEIAPGDLTILDDVRLPTAIGQETMQTGVLAPNAYRAGLRDLEVLCQEIRSLAPDRIVAVATSALRSASNSHAFIAEVQDRFGLSIEILSGEEEAMHCYRGAVSELRAWSGSLAVVDLGGGSCEIAVGEGRHYQSSYSADIGVLPIKEAFDIRNKLSSDTADAISQMVRLSLSSAPQSVLESVPDKLVFASGNGRAVYKLAASLFETDLSGQLTLSTLRKLQTLVIGRHPSEFVAHGLAPRRAEVVAIAVVVLVTIMTVLGCRRADISRRGLREGIALDELASNRKSRTRHLHNTRTRLALQAKL